MGAPVGTVKQEEGKIIDDILCSRQNRGTDIFERDCPPPLCERDDESSVGDLSVGSWSGDEEDDEEGDLPRMFADDGTPRKLLDDGDGKKPESAAAGGGRQEFL